MRNLTTLSLVTLLFLVGCAKQRPVEKIQDSEPYYAKSALTGTPEKPSNWFSRVTVVKTSNNDVGEFHGGEQSEVKVGHFEFTDNKLRFVNDVNPYGKSGSATSNLINEWTITPFDIRLEEKDGNVTNKEAEDKTKPPAQRRYFKIDFAKADIPEANSIDTRSGYLIGEYYDKTATHLVPGSIEISADYVSFVIAADYTLKPRFNAGIRSGVTGERVFSAEYRYSFRKVEPSSYKPMVLAGEKDPVMKRFGYFQTVRESIGPGGRLQTHLLVDRFDPEKEHHYYFTKDMPEEYKWIFSDPKEGVFAKTNEIFEKSGLKIRFYVHDNTWGNGKVKEFGDLRYSFIRFVPDAGSSLLGYGPHSANPFTGETLTGDVNIWTGDLIEYLERTKRTMDREDFKMVESSVYKRMKSDFDGQPKEKWSSALDLTQGPGKLLSDSLPNLTFGHAAFARFTRTAPAMTGEMSKSAISDSIDWDKFHQGKLEVLGDSPKAIAKNLAKVREEYMDQEIRNARNPRRSVRHEAEEAAEGARELFMRGRTMQEALKTLLYRVSIHEFGHNLNLRHNFYGSFDTKHWSKPIASPHASAKGDGEKLTKSGTSSVMEYLALVDDYDSAHIWEPYDVAAINYAYSSGKVNDKTPYLFCTDEHTLLNPLCNRHDTGSSPSEVAASLIKRYEDRYYESNFRNGRAYWGTGGYGRGIMRTMIDLQRFVALYGYTRGQRFFLESLGKERDLSNPNDMAELRADIQRMPFKDRQNLIKMDQGIQKDVRKAVKMVLSFFGSVFSQTTEERPIWSKFDRFSGEMEQLGISSDKVYSMLMVLSPMRYRFDPGAGSIKAFYGDLATDPEFGPLVDKVYKTMLVDSLTSKSSNFFASTPELAMEFYSSSIYEDGGTTRDVRFANRARVFYFPNRLQLQRQLGVTNDQLGTVEADAYLDVQLTNKVNSTEFTQNDTVGIVSYNGKYLVASKTANPYAYGVIEAIAEGEGNTLRAKRMLATMYHAYMKAMGLDVSTGEGDDVRID